MKVVINKCYGGFSLSARAVKRLADLQGRECYFALSTFENRKPVKTPITLEEIEARGRGAFFVAYDVPLSVVNEHAQEDWHSMTQEQRIASNAWHNEHSLDNRPADRSNPLLVQVVEELGEAANGDCAELKIVEIPDGTEYEIGEYDGREHVAEVHRTWG